MNNSIVITSISYPTEAVLSFSKMKDYRLIVVGDKKTPADWHCDNVDFIPVMEQDNLNYKLSKVLPYNHYSRKMFGYIKAIHNKADYIVDTDDDNIPKEDWMFPEFEHKYSCITENKGFVNIYQLFTRQKIWARGLPLNYIATQFEIEKHLSMRACKVGIWQGLSDEDPDVDAVYRLTNNSPCYFDRREPVVLGKGTMSPINTQNTMIRKELFALLYLPAYVSFRFTDILRGLIAQPIMWLYDYLLGVSNATVVQKRNPHVYMKDFLSEIPMYQYGDRIIDLVSASISKSENIRTNLFNAYTALLKEDIVCDKEMKILEAWLRDIEK